MVELKSQVKDRKCELDFLIQYGYTGQLPEVIIPAIGEGRPLIPTIEDRAEIAYAVAVLRDARGRKLDISNYHGKLHCGRKNYCKEGTHACECLKSLE